MNIHKRCEQNVALNCGVNRAELASKLSEIGLLNTLSKKKSQVRMVSKSLLYQGIFGFVKCTFIFFVRYFSTFVFTCVSAFFFRVLCT